MDRLELVPVSTALAWTDLHPSFSSSLSSNVYML
jgi:hypothetical protein